MKKKVLILTVLLVLFASVLSAQSADALTGMIEANEVTVGQTAYFLAVYLGAVPETATEAEAVDALIMTDVCHDGMQAEKAISYKAFAGMVMKVWNIPGGLMYSLTRADRYAFRELQALGLISSAVDPMSTISGFDALAIINDCMTQMGGE